MCSFTKSVTLKNTFWTGLQRQSWTDSDQSVYKSSVKEADVPWRGFVIVVPWDRSSPLKRVSGVAPVRIESSDSLQLWRCVITDRWHPGRFKKQTKHTHTCFASLKQPSETNTSDTWLNSCCHLLRILSALSISSSKVVFTDRLCGERSLSATWPVIVRAVGKHSHYSLICSHELYVVRSAERVFSWLLLQWHCASRGKCLYFTGTVYGAYDRL